MSSPAAERRRLQQREDTRRAILDAAEALLVEQGLDSFSMRRLAERCGYTPPTLYHYFADKEQLVDALLEERLQKLVVELRAVPRGSDAVVNVRALCLAFADFGVRNPNHYRLLSLPRDEDDLVPSGEEARGLLLAPIDALATEAGLDEAETKRLEQALWCLLHGYVLLQGTRPDEEWVPELLGRALEAMIRGSLPAPAGRAGSER